MLYYLVRSPCPTDGRLGVWACRLTLFHSNQQQDDPAWNDVMDAGLVDEVREYLERNKEAYKLGAYVLRFS